MLGTFFSKTQMVAQKDALKGRDVPLATAQTHFVFERPLKAAVPPQMAQAMFGMGCFWGVERLFWKLNGVWLSSVGYAGGFTPNPTYEEVCSGKTGHNEVVHIVFDPAVISYEALLQSFWENHDPTQGMRQGNDRGTQYRSGIYTYDAAQLTAAQASKDAVAPVLNANGYGAITTQIIPAPIYYYAEEYHQQYLAKNPNGYCGMGGLGISCPIGLGVDK